MILTALSILILPVFIVLHYTYIDSNVVVLKDPNVLEYIIRAEGKYPVRDNLFSEKLAWLYRNRLKQLPPIGTE